MLTMDQIIRANVAAGGHFFDPPTMRFWRSSIESDVLNGRFFITREDEHPAPVYQIRRALATGQIVTVGHAYRTYIEALENVPE